MAFWSKAFDMLAARLKKQPERDTYQYPALQFIGQLNNQRAHVKPVPASLRYFSRTVYARRGIKALINPITMLDWKIQPLEGVKTSPELERQIKMATECFRRPNNDDSFSSLLEKTIEDYCIFGAGVIEQQLSNNPIRPLWLYPVDAKSIQIYADWNGKNSSPRYMQSLNYNNMNFGLVEGIELRNDEIVYIVSNPSNETPYGFGPIEIAYMTISRKLGIESYAGKLASNAIPQTLLYLGERGPNELAQFRQWWTNYIEGQGQMPIVAGAIPPVNVQLHSGNDDALFLKFQEFLIRELSTAFGLSPQNFGITGDTNRSTAEVAEDRDWDQAIKPLAILIAEYFTRRILHAKLGFYQTEFVFPGLDREDEQATAQIYDTYYKSNAITPNEQRQRLGLQPMDNNWGDKCFADMEIAVAAARGTSEVDDPDISKNKLSKKSTPIKNKSKSNIKQINDGN